MKRPFRSFVTAATAAFVALAATAPSWAERLQQVGTSPDEHHDAVSIDLDSIGMSGPYRIALIVDVYGGSRTSPNGVTLDRHDQRVAFDCDAQTVSPVVVIGYLNGKQVAHSDERVDWRTKFVPVPDDALSLATLKSVCSAPLASGAAPATGRPAYAPAPTKPSMSAGSGIVVNGEGYLLTNVHVINGCKVIVAKVKGFETVPARLEAVDPKNDLALLRTRAGFGAPAVFRSETRPARLGEGVGVLGYPLPGLLSDEPKASFGEVSSVAGMGDDYTLLQFSAPITAGNSGGPVFDSFGQVIGVVVSQASLALAARIGTMPQNVNFAIKGELAQLFMTSHGVKFTTEKRERRLETETLAEQGEKSAAQIACLK
jgi:S1-C subfamily serine protease